VFLATTVGVYYADSLGHPDNYIVVDRFATPAHIVPEWYFLTWYASLRAITVKLIGVVTLVVLVLVFGLVYHVGSGISAHASLVANAEFECQVLTMVCLGCLGSCSPTFPFTEVSVFFTVLCFLLV